MIIDVKVKPNSRTETVEKLLDGSFVVRVNAPPREGKANKRVVEVLSDYFKVSKSAVNIISGEKSRRKTIRIEQ